MNTEQLLNEIEKVFPLVDKPKGIDISFHKDDCYECSYLRNDLKKYKNKSLPKEAITCIYNDMSSLSANGWRWVMPSYLKYSVLSEASYANTETEFLFYNLGPEEKYKKETIERLSSFNKNQIYCLIHFLEYCLNNKHWLEYCGNDINRAIDFLSNEMA